MPDLARSLDILKDPGRLAELAASGIMDSPVDDSFDRLTRLAAQIIRTPVALASFVDERRQFFKSRFGEIAEPWKSERQTPLSHSFCQYVVERGEPLLVEDAREHTLVRGNLAIRDLGVIAYAGVPIHAPSGSVLGSLCVIDTKERSWSKADLDVLTDLALGVDTEIALRLAREQAEAASRAKSAFLANMSHELRTPLSAVIGLTALTLDTPLNETQREYLELIESSGRDLLGLLDELLELSRIEAGRVEPVTGPFRVADLFDGPLRALGFKAEDQGLDFSIDVAPDVPDIVLGDEGKIRQLLLNLVGNALKFTHEGSLGVRVARLRATDSGRLQNPSQSDDPWLRFTVFDTGIGIHPNRQERIFKPFEQGDSSISRRFGGAGLGLSIVLQLASLLGGKVSLESEPGEGSRFFADLPLPAVDDVPADTGASDSAATDLLRPLRILLVDDNAVNLLVGQRLLEQDGHEVTTAAGGVEALDVADGTDFDAILMDLQMPDLDGLAVSRRLRKRARTADTPILALTAHAMEGDREQCLEAGMDGFLSKPLRLEDLRRKLSRLAPAASPDLPKATESQSVLRALGHSEELLHQVGLIWHGQRDNVLDALEQATRSDDRATLVQVSHKIRGTALALGAQRLAKAAEDLELGAAGGLDRREIEQRTDRFLHEFHAFSEHLAPRPAPNEAEPAGRGTT